MSSLRDWSLRNEFFKDWSLRNEFFKRLVF